MVKALVLVLLLAGCTTMKPVENPRKVWCEQNEPRRDSPDTREEQEAFLIHNLKGQEWCGWKP